MERIGFLLFLIIIGLVLGMYLFKSSEHPKPSSLEGYTDPIYLTQKKLDDWYSVTNGSIYGFGRNYGGDWNIMRGYPFYYDTVL